MPNIDFCVGVLKTEKNEQPKWAQKNFWRFQQQRKEKRKEKNNQRHVIKSFYVVVFFSYQNMKLKWAEQFSFLPDTHTHAHALKTFNK